MQIKFYTALIVLTAILISPYVFGQIDAKTYQQKIVTAGDIVTLSGSGIDLNHDSLVMWKQTSGEKVTLSSTTVAEPTFTAPYVESGKVKVLIFELSVTDSGITDNTAIKITVLPKNLPPTADAGSDQSVNKNDRVTLYGNGTDPNGDALIYHWSQVYGPVVKLSGINEQSPSFDTSTLSRSSGVLRFQLTVFDNYGGMASDGVVIKVNAAKTVLISAHAGSDQLVKEGTNVQLDGSCDELDGKLSYTWKQTHGPSVKLSSTTNADPIFTAPKIPNGPTVPIAFRFTCSVEGSGSSTDVVIIRVIPINDNPIVNAGPDKNVLSNRWVILAGSGSDPDGKIVKYAWRQVSGDDVVLASPNKSELKFIAPKISGSNSTSLEFELTAIDSYGAKGSDTVLVTVTPDNVRPSVDAGLDQTVNEKTNVALDGAAEDPDGDDLTYSWKQIGGQAVVLSSNESKTTFTAPMVANGKVKILVFELRVVDSTHSSKDTVRVTVLPVNDKPEADAGDDQTVNVGTTVTLGGSATDEDEDQLTYVWSQIKGPKAELSLITEPNVTFVAPKVLADTLLTFQLIANDGIISSEPDTVDVTVRANVSKT